MKKIEIDGNLKTKKNNYKILIKLSIFLLKPGASSEWHKIIMKETKNFWNFILLPWMCIYSASSLIKVRKPKIWFSELSGGGRGGEGVAGFSCIPELERSTAWNHGNPLQYSCLENPHGQRSHAGCSAWSHRVRHEWATKHTIYKS